MYTWKSVGRPNNPAVTAGLPKSTKELAVLAGTGTRTVEQAKTVITEATPEVKATVKAGTISLKNGAAIATGNAAKPSKPKAKPEAPPPAVAPDPHQQLQPGKPRDGARMVDAPGTVANQSELHLQGLSMGLNGKASA